MTFTLNRQAECPQIEFPTTKYKDKAVAHKAAACFFGERSTGSICRYDSLYDYWKTLRKAVSNGIQYEKIQTISRWELIFSKPRKEGDKPVVEHSKFLVCKDIVYDVCGTNDATLDTFSYAIERCIEVVIPDNTLKNRNMTLYQERHEL